jgi:transposase, IS5 family
MGLFIRTIGIERAKAKIGMANIADNLTRFVWHHRRSASA